MSSTPLPAFFLEYPNLWFTVFWCHKPKFKKYPFYKFYGVEKCLKEKKTGKNKMRITELSQVKWWSGKAKAWWNNQRYKWFRRSHHLKIQRYAKVIKIPSKRAIGRAGKQGQPLEKFKDTKKSFENFGKSKSTI